MIVYRELRRGQRLPTVRDLAQQWSIAHTTAAKALRELASEGLVNTSNHGDVVTYGTSVDRSDPRHPDHRVGLELGYLELLSRSEWRRGAETSTRANG
ncbi:GntR family transcriptional regulator [Nocardia wallacei]|uniref:GntR family transcriptional regulator n=1 Tax=Nocardia wallacei TaxID=480035 RepID=UPI002458E06F|nr:GntR family transcriptional regulator [Nocardia wallacei]